MPASRASWQRSTSTNWSPQACSALTTRISPALQRVGRAPKVYEPAAVDVHVSVPQREHGLLAGILLEAVLAQNARKDARQAALDAAAGHGRRLGYAERGRVRGRLGAERALTLAEQVLERHGFEPMRCSPTLVRLGNCPFHPYAARSADLVCGINHAFLAGFLDGLGAATVRASLIPQAGRLLRRARGRGKPAGRHAQYQHERLVTLSCELPAGGRAGQA